MGKGELRRNNDGKWIFLINVIIAATTSLKGAISGRKLKILSALF